MRKSVIVLLVILAIFMNLVVGQLLVGGFVIGMLCFFGEVFRANTPEEQLYEFSTNLLMGYKFGEGYEVVESKSQNNHPDRPQLLKIKINDDEYVRLKAHIESLEDGGKREIKGSTIYFDSIAKTDTNCRFFHKSIDTVGDRLFFSAFGNINYKTKEAIFKSTFY